MRRNAGVVTQGRTPPYTLSRQLLADKTERTLDFGYCVLRMNVGAEQH